MFLTIVAVLVAFAAGFGVGRIKNPKKLAAINAEAQAVKAEVKKVL